ncbi:MAG: antitoxin VbhA family protein [Oscillospiraceae bacterium]|nr:antitoxin VbhA family protein [Oscillospiraceae bacterium]
MSEKKLVNILKNAKTSMEIEGFVIDGELEEIGRKILEGEINIREYIEQVKREAMRYAHEA